MEWTISFGTKFGLPLGDYSVVNKFNTRKILIPILLVAL